MENLQKSTIGLVVLNYNDYQTTLNFLNMVEKNKLIDQIIVVDNNSTDDSFEFLRMRRSEKVKVVSTKVNRGYAYGNNYGIAVLNRIFKPEYVIISNPDVAFDENYIEEMLKCFKTHNNACAVAGVMKSSANINNPKTAWKLPTYFDLMLSNLLVLRRIIGDRTRYKKEYLISGRYVKVDVLAGSLLTIKNDEMSNIDGFDEETFLYEEENILFCKLKQNNRQAYLASNVSYAHNHAASINKSIPHIGRRLDIDFQSRMIYATKYLKIGTIRKLLLKITYHIGKFDYLTCLKLANIKR